MLPTFKVADLLEEMARHRSLERQTWPARAYAKAAQIVRNLDSLPESEQALLTIKGIGGSLASVIYELATEGTCDSLEEGRKNWPDLQELEAIRGVGPQKAIKLNRELGVSTLDELEQAIKDGKLKGDQSKLLKNIDFARNSSGRVPRLLAYEHIAPILERLLEIDGAKASFAGSMRRQRDTVRDVDILFSGDFFAIEKAREVYREMVDLIDADGEAKMRGVKQCGRHPIQVDLLVVPPSEWGSALAYFTGSKEHNILLRKEAMSRGWKLSEHGLFDENGKILASRTEEEIYQKFGIPFHPPELREYGVLTQDEIDAIVSDIAEDWHTHTTLSDGKLDPKALVLEAKARGLQRLGITDHYRAVDKHSAEDFAQHKARCLKAAEEVGLQTAVGLEVDIHLDGSLFGEEEVLSQCDYIIASVHLGLDNNVVERLKKAAADPRVAVLGHPTTRVLGRRPGAEGDWEGLFQICAQNNVLLEINGGPNRLDLPENLISLARSKGCKFVLCSDAHDASHLGWLQNSLAVARRAHLHPSDLGTLADCVSSQS